MTAGYRRAHGAQTPGQPAAEVRCAQCSGSRRACTGGRTADGARRVGPRLLALAARLTGREATVARLVALGSSSKCIARELGISDLTVRKHRENVLRKLELWDAARLAVCWPQIEQGLQGGAADDATD